MKNISAHLVSFSPTHSSHIIGEHIIQGIGIEETTELDLTYEGPGDTPVYFNRSVVVVAVPVYGGRVAETAMQRLQQIWGKESFIIPVVVYGNRDYEDALLELKNWGESHGFVPLAGAAFVGEHSYSRADRPIAAGRPDEADLECARSFGFRIQLLLDRPEGGEALPALVVKGNYPYKVKGPHTPQAPVTLAEHCNNCGYCVSICPVGAIDQNRVSRSNPELCIKCCACVKQCPRQARIFDTPFTDFLFKNFSARKEPELFFVEG